MAEQKTPGSLKLDETVMYGEVSGDQNLDLYDTSKDENNAIAIEDSIS